MSSKTKIVVFKAKELIYTGIFIVLGILLVCLLIYMFSSKNKEQKKQPNSSTAQSVISDGADAKVSTEESMQESLEGSAEGAIQETSEGVIKETPELFRIHQKDPQRRSQKNSQNNLLPSRRRTLLSRWLINRAFIPP